MKPQKNHTKTNKTKDKNDYQTTRMYQLAIIPWVNRLKYYAVIE